MTLYIWKYENGTFTATDVIDYATSIIWVKRTNKPGEFELYIPATAELLTLFTGDVFITRTDEKTVMYAEQVELTTDDEMGDYLTITGRSAECLLARRIVPTQTNFQNVTAENVIRSLINQNVIDPSNAARAIPFIQLGAAKGFAETINKQVTGKNLLDVITDICIEQNYCFEMTFSNGIFTFDLYKGVDRSFSQNINSPVVFSPAFENLGNTDYTRDRSTYYNAVYVAGEGEGADRKIVNVVAADNPTGFYMRETWVDARNTSSTTAGTPMTDAEYTEVLEQQGYEKLGASKETTDFSGEILNNNVYIYGVDYNLGDKVAIKNEYGVTGAATVTEMTEVEDESGYQVRPTLSEWSV